MDRQCMCYQNLICVVKAKNVRQWDSTGALLWCTRASSSSYKEIDRHSKMKGSSAVLEKYPWRMAVDDDAYLFFLEYLLIIIIV